MSSNSHLADRRAPRRRRAVGLSLVELLIAMAISAMLLTATMVAIDASFYAYAVASEESATQASTRMFTNRLLALIRTSTAHGPLLPSTDGTWPVTISGDRLTSQFIELVDPEGNVIRIEYRDDVDELWYVEDPDGAANAEPIMGGVTAATFFSDRREDDDGILVLERATIDITVQPGGDSTLALENNVASPIRVIGSTMPRKLN